MRPIHLNELPRWSPWPARLLGLEPWEIPKRTKEKIDREYNADKYAKCLSFYAENSFHPLTPEDIKQFEYGQSQTDEMCISVGSDLVITTLENAREIFSDLLINAMRDAIDASATVIELGCGYGYNLWKLQQHFPSKRFLGGEYSRNAVRLASRLYAGNATLDVYSYDFYGSLKQLLERAQPPVTIFTAHAIEQLPSAAQTIGEFIRHKEEISRVFHFEPCYELHDETLLGCMRRRYAEINDYNRDLLSELKRRVDHIHILEVRSDVFGLNPLNPTSVIEWEFCG